MMILSERFKWISDPTLVFYRHLMDNLGHALLDNYLPLFNLMMIFEYVHREHHLLYLDNVEERERSTQKVDPMSSIFSNKVPLQKCENEFGTFIGKAPCQVSSSNVE